MIKKNRIITFMVFIIAFSSIMMLTTSNILSNIKLGLDLQGGFEVLYEVHPVKENQVIDDAALSATAKALDKRVNVLGVSEPNIQIEGNNRIRVQLAGVEDQNQAREILSTQANLSFRDANDHVMMDGTDLVEGGAEQTFDENGKPIVSIKLKNAEKFREVTSNIVNKAPNNVLVIWLDYEKGKDSFVQESKKTEPKFISAPVVKQVFNQNTVSIVGDFSVEEAKNLANILNAGALPVKLDEIYSTSVGASFGEHAMNKTILAGVVGVLAVYIFMISYYRFPGFIATITLTVYSYLTLLVFDWMNVVLTLPGVAALILGVGMAVDANIITYERIREEIKVGKSIQSAFKLGNQNSFSAVTDANLTTLLASAVLFFYGTSSVKGFATSLIIGILGSFLTNVYLSRWLLGLWVNSKVFNHKPSWFGVKNDEINATSENFDTLDLPTRFDRFDFVKHRRKFFVFSGGIFILGIICLLVLRMNLGIDFSSGTRIELLSDNPITTQEVATDLKTLGLPSDNLVISGDNNNIAVVQLKGVLSKADIAKIKTHFSEELGSEPNVSSVTPTVGKELAKNAIIALLISIIGLIIFVTIRFELPMAVSAVVALLYAAFFTIPFFSLTGLEVNITFIAALLTIIGYSINDTIVTFDRMRENMQKRKYLKKFEDIVDVVNTSLRQTLGRSINTVLMVAITVISILVFGSEAIRSFSIALLVGLITGTYSSIFIASQLWVEWKHKELKKKGVIKTFKEKRTYTDEPQV